MTFASRVAARSLLVVVAVVGTAGVPSALSAQAAASTLNLVPGTRVRVLGPNMVAPLVANFLQMRGDTAVFIEDAAGRGIWSIVVSEIRKIERSSGERLTNRPYVLRGAAIGAGVGLAGGLLFANNLKADEGRQVDTWPTALVGAVLGGLIGGGIGSRFATENWTSIPLRTASIRPTSRGLMASISLAF